LRIDGDEFRVDWKRLFSLAALLLISGGAGYFLQPLISGNSDAVNTIVTIFSILAGFLIAVITFIGDPGIRGWKELQIDKRAVEAKLRRHRMLFHLYLLTLGLALAMFLVPDTFCVAELWLERFFVGSATFVFLASFSLPGSLSALQMERYEVVLNSQLPQALRSESDGDNEN